MKTINAILFNSFRNLRAIPLIALTVVGLSVPALRADTVQYSTEVSGNGIRAGWTGSGFGYCANYYTTVAGRIGSLKNGYACSTGAGSSTFQIVWAGDANGSAKPAGGAYAVYNFCQAHETLKGATGLTVNITYSNCGGNAASTTTCGHSGADDDWRRIGDLWLDGAMTAPTIKFTWASGALSSAARWYSEQFKLIQTADTWAVHIDTQPAASTTLASGSAYTISVDAGTTTGPTYQWSRSDSGPISGATLSAYTISSVAAGDAGTYTCAVGGAYGGPSNSSPAVLVVTGTPPPSSAIQGIVDNLDGTFTLTFQGTTNIEYYLVASPDVAAGLETWTPVPGSTNTAPDPSGQWSVIVSNAPPSYYRLKAITP